MKLKYIIALIGLTLIFTQCHEEEPLPVNNLVAVGNAETTEVKVNLFSDKDLIVGFNEISIELINLSTNQKITDATVDISPKMTMMDMAHSCPIENSPSTANAEGLYPVNLVFVMPSGEMGSWTVGVSFLLEGTVVEVIVPVTVVQPDPSRLISFVSSQDQTTKFFVTWIDKGDHTVGENEIEFAVYKKNGMYDWPAVEGLTIGMEPWMPSMEHGSPNNVDPADIGNGHYKGTVNYTMTGDWDITLTITDNVGEHGTVTFSTTLN